MRMLRPPFLVALLLALPLAAVAEDEGNLRARWQQLWPADARPAGPLFAMGFDAWRLISVLKEGGAPGASRCPA